MGSGNFPFACYILFDESSIPFYSTSNGYNKKKRLSRVPRLSIRFTLLLISINTNSEAFLTNSLDFIYILIFSLSGIIYI